MAILIIDYGLCNLNSIKRAIEECNHDVFISDNPKDIKLADKIILPGVGAFSDAMDNLNKKSWAEVIRTEVNEVGIPLLGICLGMQLLANNSEEGEGKVSGLGLIPGSVKKLIPKEADEKIPHVGWNEIYKEKDSLLLDEISDGVDFYFVHSYHYVPEDKNHVIAKTPYCGNFASVIQRNNIYGVQFHPEKSSLVGFKVLKNFLELC